MRAVSRPSRPANMSVLRSGGTQQTACRNRKRRVDLRRSRAAPRTRTPSRTVSSPCQTTSGPSRSVDPRSDLRRSNLTIRATSTFAASLQPFAQPLQVDFFSRDPLLRRRAPDGKPAQSFDEISIDFGPLGNEPAGLCRRFVGRARKIERETSFRSSNFPASFWWPVVRRHKPPARREARTRAPTAADVAASARA